MEYMGWSSYETWLVNDRLVEMDSAAAYWADMARDYLTQARRNLADGNADVDAAASLADLLESSFTISLPALLLPGLWQDITAASLKRVDWPQIAMAFIRGVDT